MGSNSNGGREKQAGRRLDRGVNGDQREPNDVRRGDNLRIQKEKREPTRDKDVELTPSVPERRASSTWKKKKEESV